MNAKRPAKKLLFFLFCALLLAAFLAVPASADFGPKPSTSIRFEGLEGERYAVTLLSPAPVCGPYAALSEDAGSPRFSPGDPEYPLWQAFASFSDADGWYFLQYVQDCTETATFFWGYHPPSRFKILLYFPEHNAFAVSAESFERYAFESVYTARFSGLELSPGQTLTGGFSVQRSYRYFWQIVSFLLRMLATFAIELPIALLFTYRTRKQICAILLVNLITQGALNLLLNLTAYRLGGLFVLIVFFLLEFAVFVFEALVYAFLLPCFRRAPETSPPRRWLAALYAFAANTASLAAGFLILAATPGFLLPSFV